MVKDRWMLTRCSVVSGLGSYWSGSTKQGGPSLPGGNEGQGKPLQAKRTGKDVPD